MILLEGFIDRGIHTGAGDQLDDERDEQRTAYVDGLEEHDTVVIAGQRHLATDVPSDDDHGDTWPLPRCGEGDCWHVLNGRFCPPDPWGDPEVPDLSAHVIDTDPPL